MVIRQIFRDMIGLDRQHPSHHDPEQHLFFKNGWGDPDLLAQLAKPELVTGEAREIQIEWSKHKGSHGEDVLDGTFPSSFEHAHFPEESRTAHLQMILPRGHNEESPICVIFAMTGDEGFQKRFHSFAQPLLSKGIGTILLENPFYGIRRPKNLGGFMLNSVLDMLMMSGATVAEGKSLVHWLKNEGYQNIGVAGVSQGGMVAAVVGTQIRFPVAIAASLAAHSPEVIFTEGLLRTFVDWDALPADSSGHQNHRFRELFKAGDVTELPKPVCPEAAFLQGAKRDLVVPKQSILKIHAAWPGSTMRWLPGTHVSSLALHSRGFRKLMIDSFKELSKQKKKSAN